jgi:hypothetical protein
MLANHKLARAVADASFGEIRRQVTYKTAWNGGTLIVANRWFPSSNTCSGCGAVKDKLRLSTRSYACTDCGLILDRDLNADLPRGAHTLVAYGVDPLGVTHVLTMAVSNPVVASTTTGALASTGADPSAALALTSLALGAGWLLLALRRRVRTQTS